MHIEDAIQLMQSVCAQLTRHFNATQNYVSPFGGEGPRIAYEVDVWGPARSRLVIKLIELEWQTWVVHIKLYDGANWDLLEVLVFQDLCGQYCPMCLKDCDGYTCPFQGPIQVIADPYKRKIVSAARIYLGRYEFDRVPA